NANAGDNLNITANAFNGNEFGDNPGEFQNLLDVTLNLYDSNGNLVASGDASDEGQTLTFENIQYTVPEGAGGTYYVQVTAEEKTIGEYVLNVSGNTAPADPFTVTATDPAAGAHLRSISSMTVTFNESVLLTSLNNNDFTIATDQVGGTENATSFT